MTKEICIIIVLVLFGWLAFIGALELIKRFGG